MAATTDTLKAIMDSIQFIMDSIAAQAWATSGAAGSVPDSALNYISMLGTQHPTDSALQEQIYARVDSIADTINAHAPHDDNWGGTGNATGTGSQTDTIWVYDTSGTDVVVPYTKITVKNAAQSANIAVSYANTSGYAVFALDASTEYNVLCQIYGYNFDLFNWTTGAGAWDSTYVNGYDIEVATAATPTAQMATLTGNAIYGSDTLSGCVVTVTLAGGDVFYTSTTVVPAYSQVVRADASGNWSMAVFGTDSLSAGATYTVEYAHPILQRSGMAISFDGLSIAANAISDTELRDVLAQ